MIAKRRTNYVAPYEIARLDSEGGKISVVSEEDMTKYYFSLFKKVNSGKNLTRDFGFDTW